MAPTMSPQFAKALASGPVSPDAPNVGMTPYEIYLEFRTAPFGSGSTLVALYEAAMYMGGKTTLGGAAALGTTIGTAVSGLIQTYDPTLDDAIGGTIVNMIDQIAAAETEMAAGRYEAAWNALFAIPAAAAPTTLPVSPVSTGDYGITSAQQYYSDNGGSILNNSAGGSAWGDAEGGGGGCCVQDPREPE